MANVKVFEYAAADLVTNPVPWEDLGKGFSPFDEILRSTWDDAMEKGIFRYSLDECVRKKLDLQIDGEYRLPCLALLNPQRATNRRKHEKFESMNTDFDEKQFNFTKIHENEILLEITQKMGEGIHQDEKHPVLLNISPIDYGHVLFAPFLKDCLPQKLTKRSLLLAFDVLQLSSQPSFRLGFNSLHAWAPINHLHFHGMYCDHEIFGDILPANENLAGSCYLLDFASPLPAFVFCLPGDVQEHDKIAKDVVTITDYLHRIEVPYTLLLNRGKILEKDCSRASEYTTRAIIFPRKTSEGLIPADPFDVACIEVGGHFPVKTKEYFDAITPQMASETLKAVELDRSAFSEITESVKILLSNS